MAADDGQFSLFDDVPGSGNPDTGICNPEMGKLDPETGTLDPGASPPWPPGHHEPRNGHPSPRAAGGALLFAFDWSRTRGVTAVDPAGFRWGPFRTLEHLIRELPRGVILVGESTFCSYEVQQREHVLELARSRDITLLTVPARGNTWRRLAAGMPEKTGQSKRTDFEDAVAIQHAAANGAHLKKPAVTDLAWCELRERARDHLMKLRRSGQKDDYATGMLRRLPPFIWQPDERRIALGPSGNYNLVIVAAVGVAAEFVSSRADFERLTGLYAHGYPSQFRSDLMHWGWGQQDKKQQRITLSVYRREIRWLFHQLKESDDRQPARPCPS